MGESERWTFHGRDFRQLFEVFNEEAGAIGKNPFIGDGP